MSAVFSKGVDLLGFFIESAIFIWFFSRILTDKYPKLKILTSVGSFLVLGIVPFLLKLVAPVGIAANYFYSFLVLIILLMMYVWCFKSERFEERIFWLVNGLTAFLLTSMLSTTMVIALQRNFSFENPDTVNTGSIVIFAICKLLQIGLLIVLSSQKKVIRAFNRGMILMYSLTVVAMNFIATRSMVLLSTSDRRVEVADFVVQLGLIFIGLCFLANIKFLSVEMDAAYKAKLDLSGAKLAKEHLKETQVFYDNIKGMKHDLTNHLNVLYALAKKSDSTGAIEYINALNAQIADSKSLLYTGNSTIDIIINSKREIALAGDIDYRIDAEIDGEICITAVDLAIILGNLLDNAIAGCGSQTGNKYVELKLQTEQEHLLVSIKNSVGAADKKSAKQPSVHSVGIAQIQKTIEVYGGYMLISGGETEFSIQVNVPLVDISAVC